MFFLQFIVDALEKIKTSLQEEEAEPLLEGLNSLSLECNKNENNRKFAASKDALNLLYNSCNHGYLLKDNNVLGASLDALSSLLSGQGELVNSNMIEFLANSLKELKEDILFGKIVKAVRIACVKSESNRQTFVANGVIPCLVSALMEYKKSSEIIVEICSALRVFTFDDDMSVAFGKAHEHAKLIVTENALSIILNIMETCEDIDVASELCVTLSRLAVRNEYCKDIVDLGGLKMVLKLLQEHTSNQVCIITGNRNVIRVLQLFTDTGRIVHPDEILLFLSCQEYQMCIKNLGPKIVEIKVAELHVTLH